MNHLIYLLLPLSVFTASCSTTEETTPTMDRKLVQSAVKSHLPQIKDCYERYLKTGKKEGKVSLKFEWDVQKVLMAEITESEIKDDKLHKCLTDHVLTWQMPPPPNESIATVFYPFVFIADKLETAK